MARSKSLVEVEVRGGKLAVARWAGSGGGTPLLMVHGISASHLAWSRVVNAPALDAHDIIAPDLRGRGASSALPGPYGLLQHVDDLCAVLEALALPRICFVGHSMGAYIGVHFATRVAQRLDSVVLVDGGVALPLPEGLAPAALLEKILGPALARLSREFESRAAYRAFWRAHPAFQDDGAWNEDVEAYFDYDLIGEPPHMKSRVREAAVREDGLGPMQGEMVTLMNDIRVPTLLVTAVRGLLNQPEPLMPVAAVKARCAANPAVRWRELPDTNHYSITLGAGAALLAADIAAFSAQHSSPIRAEHSHA
jgi:pimeloyl-ACP methyl ester carboxylesterase